MEGGGSEGGSSSRKGVIFSISNSISIHPSSKEVAYTSLSRKKRDKTFFFFFFDY